MGFQEQFEAFGGYLHSMNVTHSVVSSVESLGAIDNPLAKVAHNALTQQIVIDIATQARDLVVKNKGILIPMVGFGFQMYISTKSRNWAEARRERKELAARQELQARALANGGVTVSPTEQAKRDKENRESAEKFRELERKEKEAKKAATPKKEKPAAPVVVQEEKLEPASPAWTPKGKKSKK